MKILRPISTLVCCLMWTASAAAQTSPPPSGAESGGGEQTSREAESETARGPEEARGNPRAERD